VRSLAVDCALDNRSVERAFQLQSGLLGRQAITTGGGDLSDHCSDRLTWQQAAPGF